MIIGVPREIKNHEYRVSMTPGGVRQLTLSGHTARIETVPKWVNCADTDSPGVSGIASVIPPVSTTQPARSA